MANQKSAYYNQVPFEKHYQIFKNVEEKIRLQLSGLDTQEFTIGLRVAYDFIDSTNEPGVLPYKVEFGYLEPLDTVLKCSPDTAPVDRDTWEKTASGDSTTHPLSLKFLDALYDETKAALQSEAQADLRAGIFVVLYGSHIQGYSVSCTCPGIVKQYCYYSRYSATPTCYCSGNQC